MFNGLAINPAYTGSREVFNIGLMSRNQWVGITGAPVNHILSADAPLKNEKIALGLLLENDKIGVTTNNSIYVNYAYRVSLSKGKLSFGIKAGINIFNSNEQDIKTIEEDNVFSANAIKYLLPNFGTGVYFSTDKYYLGLSVPLLLSYKEKSNSTEYQVYNNARNYNFHFTSGILYTFNENFKLKPSVLIKYALNSTKSVDLNSNFILFKDILWLGASYRVGDAITGLMEIRVNKQFTIGYSYDYTLGDINKFENGSHEILLRYEFGYKIKAVNPRYF